MLPHLGLILHFAQGAQKARGIGTGGEGVAHPSSESPTEAFWAGALGWLAAWLLSLPGMQALSFPQTVEMERHLWTILPVFYFRLGLEGRTIDIVFVYG